ncbi:triose-phosphate isomerase [Heliobacterium gestii]|uniref:Triosephosphate isomerase n=1 Tax=Heliomicrobium gestii TaxID=2699 RepID=A0A845LIN3_HELGE|nr:triose-phosphate isomerase [Heliomicrobium gestii]MBM7868235.1 triosephosphate isomerase [Heliomicrobium gestii]MZP44429.1 triose-phosphate isomerase [Heliomicrobium gestii]
MRTPVLAGNWKMYLTPAEGRKMAETLRSLVAECAGREIVLCPPYTALSAVSEALEGTNVFVGGQNMHPAREGAFTGEIAPPMLIALGCRYVIIGHSERRQYFGETDATVAEKVRSALAEGLIPIVCVGETLEQREKGVTDPVVEIQVRQGLAGLSPEELAGVIIAYEPIWAIGTGRTASPDDAQQVCAFIRSVLAGLAGDKAQETRILYGGSVKPENIKELMNRPDIDGALVGGASLKAESFARIARFEEQ